MGDAQAAWEKHCKTRGMSSHVHGPAYDTFLAGYRAALTDAAEAAAAHHVECNSYQQPDTGTSWGTVASWLTDRAAEVGDHALAEEWMRCSNPRCGEPSPTTPAQPATEDEPLWDCFICGGRYPAGHAHPKDDISEWPCGDCGQQRNPCACWDEGPQQPPPASEVPDLQAALEHESGACSDLCLYCHGYLPTLAAGIEGVLGEHLYNGGGTCTCDGMAGEDINGRVEHQAAIDRHRAHVASQVIAYLHRTGAEE